MAKRRLDNIVLEDVRIIFRNFSGKEGQYNREGDRNFAALLPEDIAVQLEQDGWNIKRLKPRDPDEEPQAYMQVSVNYNNRPPRVVLVTSRNKTTLGPDEVSLLDWIDIANTDITISPYEWEVNGKTGVKAYLQTAFITMVEDELEAKYSHIPDAPDSASKAITSGAYEDMGELVEQKELEPWGR